MWEARPDQREQKGKKGVMDDTTTDVPFLKYIIY